MIASLAGVDLALIVTEPTVSGRYDLERVGRLSGALLHPGGGLREQVPGLIEDMAAEIEKSALARVRSCVPRELRPGL